MDGKRTLPGGQIIECTNGIGRLCERWDESGAHLFQYDDRGNLTGEVLSEGGVEFSTG